MYVFISRFIGFTLAVFLNCDIIIEMSQVLVSLIGMISRDVFIALAILVPFPHSYVLGVYYS